MAPVTFDGHSPEARALSGLFVQTLVVCSVIGVVVGVLVTYCIVRFREKKGAGEPPQVHGHTRLEIAWTIVPFLIVVGLFVLTLRAASVVDPPPEGEPDLVVVGHQWWWEARYPSGAVTANEIHIPVGRRMLVRVESADVIHDFWVPQLARKTDATPGHPTYIWMQADQPGVYEGACAEYCGLQHAWMRIRVVADAPEAFAAWEAHQREPAPKPVDESAQRGAQLFLGKTCVQCHAVHGLAELEARVAPDLTHLAERKTLGAGVLNNTPAELSHWLRDPQGIKAGSHMPNLNLTDAELADFTAYLETLK